MINKREFELIIKDLLENETVQQMKNYFQHCDTSCYEHCYKVSYFCYLICKKLNWDYCSVARGAMLHDLFLYDWRVSRKLRQYKGLHAFIHGKISCQNACNLFILNESEKDMIIKHMWPLTPALPKTKEGYVLTIVDKYCALLEIKKGLIKNLNTNFYFKYFYVMFILMLT